ncbi:hypothetical protein ACMD2_23036 [Ananas comosus]|uniref:Uncharacterized protein n=1 Tax=Ananas comosus TaxID=4615 RepID=A0A199VDN5_ANACO|nr:hypothetical protein ACMD2_23036 [Ananas comosus]
MKLLVEKFRVEYLSSSKVNIWRFDPESVKERSSGEKEKVEGVIELVICFFSRGFALSPSFLPKHAMKNEFQKPWNKHFGEMLLLLKKEPFEELKEIAISSFQERSTRWIFCTLLLSAWKLPDSSICKRGHLEATGEVRD